MKYCMRLNTFSKSLLFLIFFLPVVFSSLIYRPAYGQEGGQPEFPEVDLSPEPPNAESIWSLVWSPNGDKIAMGAGPGRCGYLANDYSIRILDATTGDIISRLGEVIYRCAVNSLDWSPDGSKLIANDEGGGVFVWNVSSGYGTTPFVASTVEGYIQNLWSPDGNRIASIQAQDPLLRIWDPSTGQELLSINANFPSSFTWSPDGSKLATTHNGINVWNNTTGELIAAFPMGSTRLVMWSPNGDKLAGANENHNVRVWDSTNGASLLSLSGHTGYVSQVIWSPDNRKLASASYDGTVRIWDTLTGNPLSVFQYSGEVYALDWSPDGNQVVYGGTRSDGQIAEIEIAQVSQETATPTNTPTNTPTYTPTATNTPNPGSKIVFTTNCDSGNFEIYTMNADGPAQTSIANQLAVDLSPDW